MTDEQTEKKETVVKEEKETRTQLTVSDNDNLVPSFTYDEKKTIDENASDLMELKASEQALKDNEFVETVADIKKEQIGASAKANRDIHLAKKEAERINAVTEIDVAFYEQWKAVLNFGGINEPTTKRFSSFMLWLITPFYILVTVFISMPITIVKCLFTAINGLFEQIAKFGKIGRSIALTLLSLGTMGLIAYCIYTIVMHFMGQAGF